ncbi:MAG TPA: glutamate ABC transporter substrate-binding protein, partial [Solirubrobacteraceae bacterium]
EFQSPAPSVLPRPGHMPAGTFMHEIQEKGRLVVGVDQNSLGLGYYNPSIRQMQGFDIDMVREVARAIFGKTSGHITYKAISTKQRESAIVYQDVDIVASAFSISCKRRRHVLFSSVYYVAHQRLLVPKGSGVQRLGDLRGKKVCATEKSTSIERLEALQAKTGIVPDPVSLRPDCLVRLHEGEVAAIATDDTILYGFHKQDPQTRIVGRELGDEHYGMAINRHHPEFVPFVNAVLERLRANGCATAFQQHWLQGLSTPTGARSSSRCARRAARAVPG